MSELNPSMDPSYDQLFAELEGIEQHVRPQWYVELAEQARTYEAMINELRDSGATDEEVGSFTGACIDELDAACPFNGQIVKVSGTLKDYRYDQESNTASPYEVELTSAGLYSAGFYAHTEVGDDEPAHTIMGYYFKAEGATEHVPIQIPFTEMYMEHFLFGKLDDVDIECEPDTRTRLAMLEETIPEMMSDFDFHVLNAADECEAVENMKECIVRNNGHIPNDVFIEFLKYAHDSLHFDMELPYVMELQGLMSSVDDLFNYEFVREPYLVAAFVHGMALKPIFLKQEDAYEQTEENYWHLYLGTIHTTPDGEEERRQLAVPVKTIKSMKSVRSMVFDAK